MRRRKCDRGSYFDPNTRTCHPCSDCGPGRTPIKFCRDVCNNEDEPNPSTVDMWTILPPSRHLRLAVGFYVGILALIVGIIAVVAILYRSHQLRHRRQQHQLLNHGPANDNANNATPDSRRMSELTVDTHAGLPLQVLSGSAANASSSELTFGVESRLLPGASYENAGLPLLPAMDNSLPTGIDRANAVLSQLSMMEPRRVLFAENPEYFEFDAEGGSRLCSNVCTLYAVTQPEQSDGSYHLTPSVQLPLSLSSRTAANGDL